MRKVVAICLIFCGCIISCKNKKTVEIKTETIAFKKEGELKVFKNDSLTVNFDIEIAESEYETQTGLMYRESMKNGEGMLFIFPDEAVHSFYMKNTEFSIDIIFIDSAYKIATIHKNAKPYDEASLSSNVPIKYVLEVNAGLSEKLNIVEGDSISFAKN